MAYRVFVRSGVAPGSDAVVGTFDFEAPGVIIGRAAHAQIRLPHDDVALEQARIERHPGGETLIALAPGCLCAGQALTRGQSRGLRDGEIVLVAGQFSLTYRRYSPPGVEVTSSQRTAQVARELARRILSAGRAIGVGSELCGERGAAAGKTYPVPLPGERLLLGRGSECDIVVLDADLSRVHVALERAGDEVMAIDLGSKNGTFVENQRKLEPHQPRPVEHGDLIVMGSSALRYRDPVRGYLQGLDPQGEAAVGGKSQRRSGEPRLWLGAALALAPDLPWLIALGIAIAAGSALVWLLL